MSGVEKNLVLGAAYGYGIEQVRLFAESLRRNYHGRGALLVTRWAPSELIGFLQTHQIEPIFFDRAHRVVTDVQVDRYARYCEYLCNSTTRFDRVLFTDVGDVLFQRDPFEGLPGGELFCFLEDKRATIGQCSSNSLWVRQIFGGEMLARLANCPISCSGTTIGSYAAMEKYTELLLMHASPDVMMRLPTGSRGHDQGIHNVLLHTQALPNARVLENGDHVFTLARTPNAEIRISSDGILTADGRKPAIVHQYNYHPAVLNAVQGAASNAPVSLVNPYG
jgi:hypothetical protein